MADPAIQARNKSNRAAGGRWQSDLRNGFREAGFDTERLALTGKEDEGDLVIRNFVLPGNFTVIEAKAGILHPAQFVKEAIIEADHFAKHRGLDRSYVHGLAVAKRKGMNWKDAYVLTTVREFFRLIA